MKLKESTFRGFLQQAASCASPMPKEDATVVVEHFRPHNQPIAGLAPVTFVADFQAHRYRYMEESCFPMLGYTAAYFLEHGFEAALSKWHQADFELVNTKVFPDALAYLKTVPPDSYPEYIISYNFRFRNATGDFITMLQRLTFISINPAGMPAAAIGVVFDITHFKADKSIIHTIERVVPAGEDLVKELVFKKVYPQLDGLGKPVTGREIEILRVMAQGLSSKQIAERFSISEATVVAHRKNMLRKIKVKNSAELIRYAKDRGLV